jgi:hypothetical protein
MSQATFGIAESLIDINFLMSIIETASDSDRAKLGEPSVTSH